MTLFIQLIILGLALTGLGLMAAEICRIYGKGEEIDGEIYILCVPKTKNIEGFCSAVSNRFRRCGFGEDILIFCENFSEEEKNIGRLIESADKGIYFVEAKDFPEIMRKF